ncbi:cleavage stimulation factor subunit 3-like [Actinia tenebrosa]|uniref:Cleavage stimulation factor subunit 3-like n=1 Tax=Actinia tenebrosa TaxID=6105 RepID=A0A6P8HJF3_ACTTE|nr:cleavage stimulation factor subunit 3-like [Actinia tenebrosa]
MSGAVKEEPGRQISEDQKETISFWSQSERGQKAEQRLVNHPYDLESWGVLIREAQNFPLETSKVLYERLVRRFPSSGRYWRLYIEQEMKHQNYERVEKLFQRCLIKVLNIELWKLYLTYVKETKSTLPNFREKMSQAYEFALDKIGLDFHSYQVWMDYIGFLKAGDAVGSYAENQKILTIRRVFQRAVTTPIINVEAIWREYNTFEQGINKTLAKKLIDDKTRDYMNARRMSKEFEALTRGLVRGAPSTPHLGTPEEVKQLQIWKKYIFWERSNPLWIDDTLLLTRRVMYAYEQCLQCMGFNPDIWCEAASYLETTSKQLAEKGDMQGSKLLSDEASNLYERAINGLMSLNMLLYFAYADFEEGRMKFQKSKEIYEKYIALEGVDPTLAYIQYMRFSRRAEGVKESRVVFKRGREDTRTNFHVFVGSALMEYYCGKDKSVAFKIFELGLKKYINEPEFVLAYVDFLRQLNDDNNTRVLFEKVLNTMPKEKSGEVWAKFLEFESTSGDLASILKVEKRRLQTFKEEFEQHETAVLVDRYKFLDLVPCSSLELKIMGYSGPLRQIGVISAPISCVDLQEEITEEKTVKFPLPDTTQMMPFKPTSGTVGFHSVPGGVFPIPPAAAHLMTLLPPPSCFLGPFVVVDELVRLISECTLPEHRPTSILPADSGLNGIDEENHTENTDRRGVKRAVGHDSDDESSPVIPPSHDIYRSRQQKRIH